MAEERQGSYKNYGRDPENMRRKRSSVFVELRKVRKDAELERRRNIVDNEDLEAEVGEKPSPDEIQKMLEAIVIKLSSDNMTEVRRGLDMARSMVDYSKYAPLVDEVIEAGLIPKCTLLLQSGDDDMLFDAISFFINITSEDLKHLEYLVQEDLGVVNALCSVLLRTKDKDVQGRAIWALGNLADDIKTRDRLLDEGFLDKLIELGSTPVSMIAAQNSSHERGSPLVLFRTIAWTCNRVFFVKPSPPASKVDKIIPMLCHYFAQDDNDLSYWSSKALRAAITCGKEVVQVMLNQGALTTFFMERLAFLITISDRKIVIMCLSLIFHISAKGTPDQCDALINSGPLVFTLANMLNSSESDILKYAVDILSDLVLVFVDPPKVMAEIYENEVPIRLIGLFGTENPKLQWSLTAAVTNCIFRSSPSEVMYLFSIGVARALGEQVKSSHVGNIRDALDGIQRMLQTCDPADEGLGLIKQEIEECGGLNAIEGLQMNANSEISERAVAIIDNFFSAAEDQEMVDL